jgi:hypothetical protein
MTGILVGKLPNTEYDEWSRLVSGSPDGSIFNLPNYLDILCRAAGGRYTVLGVRHGDEMAGGVALYESDSRYGVQVAPRHLLSYNGIVLQRYATKFPSQQTARHIKIMTSLVGALAQCGYARVTLNCRSSIVDLRPFLAAGWSASPYYTYIVPIADPDLLWERIEQNLRRLIRRCEKDGITATWDEDFDAFYRLHATTMRRKGHLPYLPESSFRTYFKALRERDLCRLFHARLPDGRPIATQLVLLGPGSITHTVTAASDPEFLQTGVNAFLRWKSFLAVSEMGYSGNDLTGAGLTPVTHFKSQLGGDLHMFLALNSPRTMGNRLRDRTDHFLGRIRKALKPAIRRIGADGRE